MKTNFVLLSANDDGDLFVLDLFSADENRNAWPTLFFGFVDNSHFATVEVILEDEEANEEANEEDDNGDGGLTSNIVVTRKFDTYKELHDTFYQQEVIICILF